MNLYKKCAEKPYSFWLLILLILLERLQKLIMTIDDKVIDEKLQYNIHRETAKMSALSSGKIDKYEYLTGEKILPSDQIRIKKQAKFIYSLFSKAFEKQPKTLEEQGKKL